MAGRLAARCRQMLNSYAAQVPKLRRCALPAAGCRLLWQATRARCTHRGQVCTEQSFLSGTLDPRPAAPCACFHTTQKRVRGLAGSPCCCSAAQGAAPSVWGPLTFCAGTSAAAFALAASACDERERSISETGRLRQQLGEPRFPPLFQKRLLVATLFCSVRRWLGRTFSCFA